MTIKFIALDTDGTLLNSIGKILPSTKKAVKTALDQGIKVALCSGRPIAGLKHFMDELGIIGPDQYAITLNGAITRTADCHCCRWPHASQYESGTEPPVPLR